MAALGKKSGEQTQWTQYQASEIPGHDVVPTLACQECGQRSQ